VKGRDGRTREEFQELGIDDKKERELKKLVAIGSMLAMMLVAMAPASASTFNEVDVLDASQFQFAAQVNTGDANAAADDGSFATASIEQDLTQTQVNGGFGDGFFFVD
jgi:hypothetical protein